jgi:hypothetical protein
MSFTWRSAMSRGLLSGQRRGEDRKPDDRRSETHSMLKSPKFQTLWFKTRGTRTVQPKPVPSCSQSFLTGHCRATAAV